MPAFRVLCALIQSLHKQPFELSPCHIGKTRRLWASKPSMRLLIPLLMANAKLQFSPFYAPHPEVVPVV
jgi:hypothetical protein